MTLELFKQIVSQTHDAEVKSQIVGEKLRVVVLFKNNDILHTEIPFNNLGIDGSTSLACMSLLEELVARGISQLVFKTRIL